MDYKETKKNVTEIDKLFFDIENIEIKSQILIEVLWLMNDDFKIRAFKALKKKMNKIIKEEKKPEGRKDQDLIDQKWRKVSELGI